MGYEVIDVTPTTPEWVEERRKSIGASEVPAILGISPYQDDTPLAVYESKLGIDRPFDPELAWLGVRQEQVMADWLAKFRPLDVPPVLPGFMARSVEWPWLHATFDRVADDAGLLLPIQMKTAHSFAAREWADGVPVAVQAQVQAELAVIGAPYGWALGLVGGRTFHLHKVHRDDEWISEYLVPATRRFWEDHVQAKRPPEVVSAVEHARAWQPAPGKSVELTDTLAEALDRRDVLLSDARDLEKQAAALKAEADEVQTAILNYAEDARYVTRGGVPVFEITQRSRRSIAVSDVEAEFPEALRLVRVSRWSVLQRVKEAKGGE